MDGASKFVRGDAIAGIIITVINIVGGLIIGMAEHGMPLGRGGQRLHAAHDRRRPGEPGAGVPHLAGRRLARHAQHAEVEPAAGVPAAALFAAASAGRDRRLLGILVFTSLPRMPLLALGAACLGLSRMMTRRESREAEAAAAAGRQGQRRPSRRNASRITSPSIRWRSSSASA